MADDDILSRYYGPVAPADPEAPPAAWRRPEPLTALLGPPDYAHAPKLRPNALPDMGGALMRGRVDASRTPLESWHDDHSDYMRNFMRQATGMVPGLHSAQNAYNAWADPEHPVTQEGRSVPKALGWGALGLAETVGGPLLAKTGGDYLAGKGGFSPQSVNLPENAGMRILQWHGQDNPAEAIPSIAGLFGLGANRKFTATPNPETVAHYNPYVPNAIRPQPRTDAVSVLPPASRPIADLKVHAEPVEAYHGTNASFDRFDKGHLRDFGIHSGTPKAANDRLASSYADDARVLPMRLGPPDRPFTSLEVSDLGVWQPLPLARELERRGIRFSPEEFEAILGKGRAGPRKEEAYPIIENTLNRHGVDALRYRNSVEDPGSTSWVTWNPETLYSKTTGARLYGLGAGATAAPIAGALLDREYGDPTKP